MSLEAPLNTQHELLNMFQKINPANPIAIICLIYIGTRILNMTQQFFELHINANLTKKCTKIYLKLM